jgi:hypothetical protein
MLLEPPTDTLPRYRGSVANRAWRPPFAPDVFRRGVTFGMVAWFGKDALVDRRRLYKIAHQASPTIKVPHYHPPDCVSNFEQF